MEEEVLEKAVLLRVRGSNEKIKDILVKDVANLLDEDEDEVSATFDSLQREGKISKSDLGGYSANF